MQPTEYRALGAQAFGVGTKAPNDTGSYSQGYHVPAGANKLNLGSRGTP